MTVKLSSLSKEIKSILYGCAWLAYIILAPLLFPILSITTLLISIALCMFGAWLFGFPGSIITTALTIPFHFILLHIYSDNAEIQKEAFNLFGISTQLCVSGSIALHRNNKLKMQRLNEKLESMVQERRNELIRIQNFIISTRESRQRLLCHMLLEEAGNSLIKMSNMSDHLLTHLVFENNPLSDRVAKLVILTNRCVTSINELEFEDNFLSDTNTDFITAISSISEQLSETTNTSFITKTSVDLSTVSMHLQHQLYRIAHEAITNAVRHGEASEVQIELSMEDGCYDLSVINDGNPMPADIKKGLGMKLMQHRTEQLGGSLSLTTTLDEKTRFHCSIPGSDHT